MENEILSRITNLKNFIIYGINNYNDFLKDKDIFLNNLNEIEDKIKYYFKIFNINSSININNNNNNPYYIRYTSSDKKLLENYDNIKLHYNYDLFDFKYSPIKNNLNTISAEKHYSQILNNNNNITKLYFPITSNLNNHNNNNNSLKDLFKHNRNNSTKINNDFFINKHSLIQKTDNSNIISSNKKENKHNLKLEINNNNEKNYFLDKYNFYELSEKKKNNSNKNK